jgi:peptidoglycan/LPS O-acetylase OafA/YrhL
MMAEVFDPRANALNAIRFMLAVGVVLWHSFPLSGNDIQFAPLRQLFANVWVDGFFAISGFLIIGSWVRNPSLRQFLVARCLRIFPGFWACLLVTGFVIAPVSAVIVSNQSYVDSISWDNLRYVLSNSLLRVEQPGISGTLLNVPYVGSWNGSLWTLGWEFLCYLGVAVLGITLLITRRHTILVLFSIATAVSLLSSLGITENGFIQNASRFSMMFLAGAVVHRYSSGMRLNALWILAASAVLFGALWLPDYRIVAAVPLAYLLIGIGALAKTDVFVLRNDLSYGMYVYAFPVQQTLASIGADALGPYSFAVVSLVCTWPFAMFSWFAIERNALKLKPRRADVARVSTNHHNAPDPAQTI